MPNIPIRLTKAQCRDMQDQLIEGYEKEAFQKELHMIWYVTDDAMKRLKMRQELCLTVQGPIIKKFGFEATRKGVAQSVMAFNDPEIAMDPEIVAQNAKMGVLVNPDMQEGKGTDIPWPNQAYTPQERPQPKAAPQPKAPPVQRAPPQPPPQQPQPQQSTQLVEAQVPLEEAFLNRFNLGPPDGFNHLKTEQESRVPYGHIPTLSRESAIAMLNELIAGFVKEDFQRRLRQAIDSGKGNPAKARAARQKVTMEVQIPIVAKYGFEASFNGVLLSAKAFTEEMMADPETMQKNQLVFWLIDPQAQAWTPVPKGPSRIVLYTTVVVKGDGGKGGKLTSFTADLTDTIRSLKENIQLKTSILWQSQKLFVGDHELDDWTLMHTLTYVGSTVELGLRRRRDDVVDWLVQVTESVECLQKAPKHLLADWEFMWPAIQLQAKALTFAPPEIQANRDVLKRVVEHAGQAIQFAHPSMRADREVVLQAVRHDGWALQYADPKLQGDREIVLNAVWQDGWSIQFAAAWLRGDREIVMTAAAKDAWVIGSAAPELQSDRTVVLVAVKQDWRVMETINEALKDDKEIVLAGVKQDGWALEYASARMKADREVVLEAARRRGESLRFAHKSLLSDKEIACLAIKNCGIALSLISPEIQDLDMVLMAVKNDPRAFGFVEPRLHEEVKKKLGFHTMPGWNQRAPPPSGPNFGGSGTTRMVLPSVKKHFEMLGLPESATPEEIKKTYRKLALKNHPDKHGGSEQAKQIFQKINNAYQALKEVLNI